MKIISTKVHGLIDYFYGTALLLSPWIWDYNATGSESLIPILLGVSLLAISLMTDYEKSLLRLISMKNHLRLDLLSGIFLAASPWLFQFKDTVYLPHVIFGSVAIVAALLTKTKPDEGKDDNLI